MSRTSKTLKRLGVAALATVTMGAGIPALVATSAQAATTASFTITPQNQQAAQNDCLLFTVTANDAAGGNATDTPTVTIVLTEDPADADTNTDVAFCGTATSGTPVQGDAEEVRARFQTQRVNNASSADFGVTRTDVGGVRITAFQDINGNGVQDNGEPGSTNVATASFVPVNTTSSEARNIVLTPESTTTTSGQRSETFTATVEDINDVRVQGATVTVTITDGPGSITGANGSRTVVLTTNSTGQVSFTTSTDAGATGTQTIQVALQAGTTDCDLAAGQPAGSSAGNCTDTSTNNVVAASASPSPSNTASPSPTNTTSPSPSGNASPPAVACNPAQIRLFDTIIIATGAARGEVRGTPNSVVLLRAYTRPSTTFFTARRIEVGADGVGEFLITPPGNTRMFAVQEGCTETSQQIVLNVRTQLSLNVERLGKQTYRFFGSAIPARPNGLIISLYRITDSGRQVLTAQTRANANAGQPGFNPALRAGSYSITRRFTGTGRFGFVVRTGQDLTNAPGSSNVRSLLIF